ncbi:MAG: ThiF family adenylyltransferase [Mucilaginibacter sp.]
MDGRVDLITSSIRQFPGVELTTPFVAEGNILSGEIVLPVGESRLNFAVEIRSHYPFQYHDSETIRFINRALIPYDHVNADGSICVHTTHSPDLVTKIALDLSALEQWVKKYYLAKEKDNHYEHIMVVPSGSGTNQALWFTDVDYQFSDQDFGEFQYSLLANGYIKDRPINTFIIQEFKTKNGLIPCSWNSLYKTLHKSVGVYLFIEAPPTENRRFAVRNWEDLHPFVSRAFLKYLYDFGRNLTNSKIKNLEFKLIIGYRIPDGIHWQAINVKKEEFPLFVEKTGPKTYDGKFDDQAIDWMTTKNCSERYFFGRGAFCPKLAKGRILIIGIGAIGSMVASTLIRGGCQVLFLNDHDVKEPENICRSEYQFSTGMVSKVYELKNRLMEISPLAEVTGNEELTDIIKSFRVHEKWKGVLEDAFNRFDYIFDCTTDNDLAYIFSELTLDVEVVNISITNHAKQLVCVFKPDLYKWLMSIFNTLDNDMNDLFNPTGCWSPTFKAGYNDIAVLVQYALKQVNHLLANDRPLRNFYLEVTEEDNVAIKLNEF